MSDKVEALTRSHLLPDSIAPTSVETVAVHLDPSWMDIRYIAHRRLKAQLWVTNHLRVTWPFWTRFVLNPIVGIELKQGLARQPSVAQSGQALHDGDLLYSELAALYCGISAEDR